MSGESPDTAREPRALPITRFLSRDYRGLKFKPLPGSAVEATNVARLLGEKATLRLGAEARETELKSVVSPRVLHLATHGFFLSDQELRHTNSGRADLLVGFDARQRVPTSQNDWENPLVRCGIALAGANHFTNSFFGRAGSPARRIPVFNERRARSDAPYLGY